MEILYKDIQFDIEATQDLINTTDNIIIDHELAFLSTFEEFDIMTNIPFLDMLCDIEPELYI